MLGAIFIAHGWQKLTGFSGTVGMIRDGLGFPLPELFAILLVAGELLGGILVLVGLAPRLGALAIAITMVVALLTVHAGEGFLATHVQQLALAGSVTILIGGAGLPALTPSRKKKPDAAD
jgi:putative oxidoreductase